MYADGIGVRKSCRRAVELFRCAAEQGHARAQAKLAWHLMHGRGCPMDTMEAYNYYLRAAEAGNVGAMYQVAQCLENGWGVGQNIDAAIKFYERAASSGDQTSFDRLIGLVNPRIMADLFQFGYTACAA
jgi:TPR repeat protein